MASHQFYMKKAPVAYRMEGAQIASVFEHAYGLVQQGMPFAAVCRDVMATISRTLTVNGAEHIPETGPVLVACEHPTHMDYFAAGTLLERRPDSLIVARVPPPEKEKFPQRSAMIDEAGVFLPLHSASDGGYVFENVRQLLEQLRSGRLLALVSWGCMNHQASDQCTAKRAVSNVQRLAAVACATVVRCDLSVKAAGEQWPGSLPFDGMNVQLYPPIAHDDAAGIEQALLAMYPS